MFGGITWGGLGEKQITDDSSTWVGLLFGLMIKVRLEKWRGLWHITTLSL
jgi:hypothetical protein